MDARVKTKFQILLWATISRKLWRVMIFNGLKGHGKLTNILFFVIPCFCRGTYDGSGVANSCCFARSYLFIISLVYQLVNDCWMFPYIETTNIIISIALMYCLLKDLFMILSNLHWRNVYSWFIRSNSFGIYFYHATHGWLGTKRSIDSPMWVKPFADI